MRFLEIECVPARFLLWEFFQDNLCIYELVTTTAKAHVHGNENDRKKSSQDQE